VILAVNGKKTKGKEMPEIAYEVRGPAGESVKLKILRDDEVLSLKIVRENIKLKKVEGGKVNSSTAFISIDGFSSRTVDEVTEKLKALDDISLTKLIIDLRFNNGGEYEAGLKSRT
jgi:carboxyl-terminal processing protease